MQLCPSSWAGSGTPAELFLIMLLRWLQETSIIDALDIPACLERHREQPARRWGRLRALLRTWGPGDSGRQPWLLTLSPTGALPCQPQYLRTQSETSDPGLGVWPQFPGTEVLGRR